MELGLCVFGVEFVSCPRVGGWIHVSSVRRELHSGVVCVLRVEFMYYVNSIALFKLGKYD